MKRGVRYGVRGVWYKGCVKRGKVWGESDVA